MRFELLDRETPSKISCDLVANPPPLIHPIQRQKTVLLSLLMLAAMVS